LRSQHWHPLAMSLLLVITAVFVAACEGGGY
jgi:hypothetical protein